MKRRRNGPPPKYTVDIDPPLTPELARVVRCYNGSDGDATRALYTDIQAEGGPLGQIAVCLMRAEKNSARAKVYRGPSIGKAYETKQWSMDQLCRVLVECAEDYGIVWGWQADAAQAYHSMVLYVEMPGFGQASFHTRERGAGPDYPRRWDGLRGVTAERILRFAASVLAGTVPALAERETA